MDSVLGWLCLGPWNQYQHGNQTVMDVCWAVAMPQMVRVWKKRFLVPSGESVRKHLQIQVVRRGWKESLANYQTIELCWARTEVACCQLFWNTPSEWRMDLKLSKWTRWFYWCQPFWMLHRQSLCTWFFSKVPGRDIGLSFTSNYSEETSSLRGKKINSMFWSKSVCHSGPQFLSR